MTTVKLYIFVDSPPPSKQQWTTTSRSKDKWKTIFEIVANFFCLSNGFRHENTLYIFFISKQQQIKLDGEKIRYLSPNSRSVASLLWKAYQLMKNEFTEWTESTPGVYVKILPQKKLQKILQTVPVLEIGENHSTFVAKNLIVNFADMQVESTAKIYSKFCTYTQALTVLLNFDIFPV